MPLWKTLKRIDKLIGYVVVGLLLLGLTYTFGTAYLAMPSFMYAIRDDLEKNEKLMMRIGPITGQAMQFSNDGLKEGDSATFKVVITGECDSAFVRIRGYYYQKDKMLHYVITDTAQVNRCH